MKNILLPIFLILTTTMTVMAQDDSRPGWLANKPRAGNSSYIYVVERGTGLSLNEAVNNALLKVFRTTMMRLGTTVSWDEVNKSLQNGTDWGTVAIQYNIPINKVCEYVERQNSLGYVVAVLCQVAKNGYQYPEFDEFTACSDTKSYNDFEAALKSAVLPGLGQISKRHYRSGYITMGGEALLLSGCIISYALGYSYVDDLSGIDPERIYKSYVLYNSWRKINNVFCVAAAALYVFNIWRAYSMLPHYQTDILTLEPTLMQTDQSLAVGFGVTLNF